MNITSFSPMVLTKNAKETIRLFEELGFQKRHAPTIDTGTSMASGITMADANGFRVDVADVQGLSQDATIIRVNVDDFDEAYKMLTAKGFTHHKGYQAVSMPSSKSALMESPSGVSIYLVQHIKK